MYVAILRIELHIPAARSIKDKRQVVKSILGKLKNRNVSILEIDNQDLLQRASLGMAIAAHDKTSAESIANSTLEFIESSYEVELIEAELEIV
jgi:hypothetical protein